MLVLLRGFVFFVWAGCLLFMKYFSLLLRSVVRLVPLLHGFTALSISSSVSAINGPDSFINLDRPKQCGR